MFMFICFRHAPRPRNSGSIDNLDKACWAQAFHLLLNSYAGNHSMRASFVFCAILLLLNMVVKNKNLGSQEQKSGVTSALNPVATGRHCGGDGTFLKRDG